MLHSVGIRRKRTRNPVIPTNPPNLEPQTYEMKPVVPNIEIMFYDGTEESFHAIRKWLKERFPDESIVSGDDPNSDSFTIGSYHLSVNFQNWSYGTGNPEHRVSKNTWIWVEEDGTIDSGINPPGVFVQYHPVGE